MMYALWRTLFSGKCRQVLLHSAEFTFQFFNHQIKENEQRCSQKANGQKNQYFKCIHSCSAPVSKDFEERSA